MYLCVCKAITDKQIEEATKTTKSIGEVCKKLGVGSECGVCLSEIITNHKSRQQTKTKTTKQN